MSVTVSILVMTVVVAGTTTSAVTRALGAEATSAEAEAGRTLVHAAVMMIGTVELEGIAVTVMSRGLMLATHVIVLSIAIAS
jgi:hypothetical protein